MKERRMVVLKLQGVKGQAPQRLSEKHKKEQVRQAYVSIYQMKGSHDVLVGVTFEPLLCP